MLVTMVRNGVVAVAAVVALLLSATVAAEPTVPSGLEARLREAHRIHRDHAGRLEAVSRLFIGAAFARSPLGEGAGQQPDPDPTMDLSRFDCVTYVEQVMALSWHRDLQRASTELQRIRYTAGQIRYGARKHIMMAQWIPQNVAAGFVADITREVAGSATRTALLTVDSSDFDRGLGKRLAIPAADRPRGTYTLDVVGVTDLLRRIDRVPHGTVLTTIRRARAGVPYRASHVGLVVAVAGERRIRHADRRARAVVDEPLAGYLRRARRLRHPPVEGFHLLSVAATSPAEAVPAQAL